MDPTKTSAALSASIAASMEMFRKAREGTADPKEVKLVLKETRQTLNEARAVSKRR